MKFPVFAITLFFCDLTFAIDNISFSENAHITMNSYAVDNSRSPIECHAYAQRELEGIKLNLTFGSELTYSLECKGHEVGASFNLLVKDNKGQLTNVENVAYSGGDEGYSGETQSWLVDLNNDKFPDLIKRGIYSDSDKTPPTSDDKLQVFYWDKKAKKYVSKEVAEAQLNQYKEKYKFIK